MQEITQTLDEVKGLYHKVLGKPAPEIEPASYVPFPPGVDPIKMAIEEVRHLKRFSEELAHAPAPIAWVPRADSFVTNDGIVIYLEIPGMSREDLKVFAVGQELIVRGDRRPENNTADLRPLAIERAWGPFERRFALPPGTPVDHVHARYLHGVLEIKVTGKVTGLSTEMAVEIA